MYDDLIGELYFVASNVQSKNMRELLERAASAIEDLKTTAADVRPVVRGKWIKYAPHNSDMMTCSECEKYWILDGDQYDYHYCPNCGADMREES